MLGRQTDDLAAQVQIFEATPIDMNEVRIVFMDKPSRACRIIVATARHHGDVSALDDPRSRRSYPARSAAEQARAAEAMIDEALRNPYGRLAADLRRLGMLPQKET